MDMMLEKGMVSKGQATTAHDKMGVRMTECTPVAADSKQHKMLSVSKGMGDHGNKSDEPRSKTS